jgi:hypothetical protein
LGPLAGGGVAFAVGFVVYAWLAHDAGPAGSDSRAEPGAVAFNASTASPAGLEAEGSAAPLRQSVLPETISARASFGARFAFGPTAAASPHSPQVPVSFANRFNGDDLGVGPVRSSVATPRTTIARAPKAAPAQAATTRSAAARAAPKRERKAGFELASASETELPLGYASTESANSAGITGSLEAPAKDPDPLADIDSSHTAIYDITSHTVYLPDGRRLEAHSGLGSHMDDPRSVAIRNTGVTPPNVYDLKMRGSLFHGVRALRLIPKDESKMYGRSGILAHSYMLGPNGQSNGCVSFSNYSAFLEAYQRGDIRRVVVVEHLADVPSPKTAADWFANKLKDLFRRT